MGKLTGLVMIAAGLGTAAYVYPLISDRSDKAEKQLADVVTIATPEIKRAPVVVSPRVASKGDTRAEPPRVVTAPLAIAPVLTAPPVVIATAPAIATTPPPVAVAKPIEPPVPQPARRAKSDDDKATLTRAIQSELKRVGCYAGETDGTWNAATRTAIKSFIDRVNATLPTDEPDHILKTLVQGHPGNACGKSCPSGQTTASDGRCLPTSIMTKGPAPVTRSVNTAAASEPTARPSPPKPATPTVSTWETTTTPSATPAPAMASIAAAAGAVAARPLDLPGRMAIGAPQGTPEATAVTSAPVVTEPPTTRLVSKPKPETNDTAERSERAERSQRTERSEPRRSPPRIAAYRAPPPRYVGVYSPPSAPRQRFGPQIFRQLELSGR